MYLCVDLRVRDVRSATVNFLDVCVCLYMDLWRDVSGTIVYFLYVCLSVCPCVCVCVCVYVFICGCACARCEEHYIHVHINRAL